MIVGLITIGDIEQATGKPVLPADVDRVNFLIQVVSAYIEKYTDQTFNTVEGEVRRCQADGWGIIEFADVDEVTAVYEPGTTVGVPYWEFDHMCRIYDLDPFQVVDAVISYGWGYVPDDIKGIAVDLVAAGSGLAPGAANGIISKRVGDNERKYGVLPGTSAVVISDLQATVLDTYRDTGAHTLRLGP